MKKIEYQAPEMEIVEIKMTTTLLAGSPNTDGTGQEFNEDPADPGTFIPD